MGRDQLFKVTTPGDELRKRAAKERGLFINVGEHRIPEHQPSEKGAIPKTGRDCFVVDWCMDQ